MVGIGVLLRVRRWRTNGCVAITLGDVGLCEVEGWLGRGRPEISFTLVAQALFTLGG
jgi:hypothetical protein